MRTHQGILRARGVRLFIGLAVVLWGLMLGMVPAAHAADPAQGPGGPILVVTSGSSTFGKYFAEILRTEGLNSFAVADISTVTAGTLAAYDVVILAKMPLVSTQVSILSTWVNGGGNLIAMAPDAQLASLLGLTSLGTSLSNGYLLVDGSTSPGNGIVNQTIQFHGAASLYSLNGAASLATLYSTASAATTSPAVTLRTFGTGKAAAFTYDLAASIVYTRQGNPAWAAQERDGFAPIRSDDKFFGNAAGDAQPDWVDLTKVAIPQADEQQRLLANLILSMNASKKPLPRFWYFPNGKKAVVVMTGDDHGNGGTAGRFDQFLALSPAGCSVANWECVRGTSYMYANTPVTNAQAAQYASQGFEVGLHVSTNCADFDLASLQATYAREVADWKAKYTGIPSLPTQRHHCIVWSDWTSGAEVQLSYGMRMDTSYYFWPPSWVGDVPGMFTGSAMPMRFARLDGSFVDVYMAATQMTDESGQTYPYTVDTLLDRALGAEGYYGAYVINAHTDLPTEIESDTTVSSALARGVPVVSAQQMLTWVDARNSSSFGAVSYSAGTGALSFTVAKDPAANGLQGMLPVQSGSRVLSGISRGGSAISSTVSTVKGVDYAFFSADAGSYVATYSADAAGPTVASTSPAAGATGIAVGAKITVSFSEAMTASTINASTFELRNAANTLVSATVSYDAAARKATLTPLSALVASSTYTATVHGGTADPRVKDAAGNALATNVVWSFTTGAAVPPPTCPCSGWSSATVPAHPSVADPNAVELGVKFTADVNGYISGIRFYKGTTNTGTHVGNLWSASGALLATATFTSETGSGWQQVTFAQPVAVTANVVYVASYFAPNGNYAGDSNYFATAGVDNGPIHLLKSGVSGGNGVYQYNGASIFPSSTYSATNYWVDVVFSTTAPADTTPPTVTSVSPAQGATGVATGAAITATFSEAMSTASISTSSVELRATTGGALITSTVAYNAQTNTVTLTPGAALAASTGYTVNVKGGATDPRVKDVAGNALQTTQTWAFTTAAAGGGCGAPANAIVGENCLTGNPASEWDVSGSGDPSIQGYATDISVNRGATVSFKVSTNATAYRFDIYRMGYYGGLGARKVASVTPLATLPQTQPNCLNDAATGLVDCGNWGVSGSWAVPATAVSGIYFARVVRTDTGGASHIVFVVRNDASTSAMLFQTSDTTWQAYNQYGGNSLYVGLPAGRAYKVSYNRPFITRAGGTNHDWVFNAEYPMVRWLESNGYDLSYMSGLDSDRIGNLILKHKAFLSVGHDEYWSAGQRTNVTAARDAGVNLAFFSGNEIFWKTRWEPSIDGSNTPNRTLVSYKETTANAKIDPTSAWTGTWRDPRFSPPADGGKPENALTGTLFMTNDTGTPYAITVPEADGKMRLWRNTSIATLSAGQTATLPTGTLGYEWDSDVDNGFRPAGLIRMSTTTLTTSGVLLDYGTNYGSGTQTHALTLYKHSSGAKVFGAGTIQWSWGLDANHDGAGTAIDVRMQQATVNLFADMGVQPASMQSGLVAATASTDVVAPTATITAPPTGSNVSTGNLVTIGGTASDTGGVVGGVEVSVDGGTTWHPATGRASWSYNWTPTAVGSYSIKARATDDSGNIGVPSAGITVTVGAQVCPCTIFSSAAVPTVVSDGDTGAVNLGVQFTSDLAGSITGIRFYKGAANTGTHVGSLWTSSGTLLATATFTGETASGWQQVNFATPVAVTAGTVYVASYFAPVGRYAADGAFFSSAATDNPPLHAPSGTNGVYKYGTSNAFPSSAYQSTNYWVDAVFVPTGPDSTPPTVSSTTPAGGATGVGPGTTVKATFSEAMTATTIGTSTFELRDSTNALVSSTVTYDATTRTATLTPGNSLAASSTYTATVKGGATDPRVKDLAGNALAGNVSWSFTTSAADTTPPTVSSTTPASGATGVSATTTVRATFSEPMTAASVATTSFELRNSVSALVTSTVTYDSATQSAILTPSAVLGASSTYTATVKGGTTDPRVKDVAGNALAGNLTWSFTTAAASACPCSAWPASATPGTASVNDPSAVNLGVKFTSDKSGFITGIRFYKGSTNTGTHVGALWTSSGTLLASATFAGETATGWQQVSFAAPVAITAGTVYVASYFAPKGGYAGDNNFFASSGVDNAPIHLPANGTSGGNGVYLYGAASAFPSQTWQSSNYWVDVVFTP